MKVQHDNNLAEFSMGTQFGTLFLAYTRLLKLTIMLTPYPKVIGSWVDCAKRVLKEVAMKNKLKTKRGAAKRFKKTANGFKRKQAFKRHILTKKSPKRIRQLRGCVMVHVSDVAAVRRMCPYI